MFMSSSDAQLFLTEGHIFLAPLLEDGWVQLSLVRDQKTKL